MSEQWRFDAPDEEATKEVGSWLVKLLKPGDVVLLSGELGAGKTTLVRGFLAALGYREPVRSPTFGLIQAFETSPPVVHADLYRVKTHQGLGLEDYLTTHVCFVEWPDRAISLLPPEATWKVSIEFAESGRRVEAESPEGWNPATS